MLSLHVPLWEGYWMGYGASYVPLSSLVGQAKDVFSNGQVYKSVSFSNASRRTSSRAVRFCVCGLKPTRVGRFVPCWAPWSDHATDLVLQMSKAAGQDLPLVITDRKYLLRLSADCCKLLSLSQSYEIPSQGIPHISCGFLNAGDFDKLHLFSENRASIYILMQM